MRAVDSFSIVQGESLAWPDLAALTQRHFSGAMLCMLEATDSARFFPMRAEALGLTPPSWWESCFACRLFSEKAELRLEKTPFSARADYRLLTDDPVRDMPKQRGFVRESSYILRPSFSAVHAELSVPELDGRVLLYREYFTPNEAGWLVPVDARFSGLGKGGRHDQR